MVNGTFYFPAAHMNFTGSGSMTSVAQIIARFVFDVQWQR